MNQLRASSKVLSPEAIAPGQFFATTSSTGPCPSRSSPTASDGRFFLLLENELCFHSLFLMGDERTGAGL